MAVGNLDSGWNPTITSRMLKQPQRLSVRVAALAAFGACLLAPTPARAVEPLWGEMPLTLGKGTFHPVYRTRYLDAGEKRSGRMRMWEQELMFDYAPSASLNLRLDIPYLNSIQEGAHARGHSHSARGGRAVVSGLGDISLRGKQRISGTRGQGSQSQHSLLYGLKLPTGEDGHTIRPGGGGRRRLDPSDQTGTGNPGLLLGYGWTGETLWEAAWAGVTWRRDVGGGFRLGDTVEATATAARWFKRPDEAEDLGLKLSTGVTGLYHGADFGSRGEDLGNAYGYAGFHLTPIVTKGNYILQLGVMVPLVRGGADHRSDFPYEVRFGVETFF
jgi:hypothetical protein